MEDTQNVKFEPKPLIIRITASVLVLLIGAAVFMQLERRSESRSLSGLSLLTKRKLNLAAKYNLSADDLALLETAIKQEALAIEKDQVDIGSRWTYSNSVFFVFTIMTTIGKKPRTYDFSHSVNYNTKYLLFGQSYVGPEELGNQRHETLLYIQLNTSVFQTKQEMMLWIFSNSMKKYKIKWH